jgi:putative glutamine amidotransferase
MVACLSLTASPAFRHATDRRRPPQDRPLRLLFQHADPARSLFTNKTLQYVEQSIAHWLMSAGAMVVMVPCPTGETARGDTTLAHYAEWLDGVVMHGGSDVWPGSYGEEPLKDAWVGDRIRDLYDLALVEAFAQAGKPIFGVCRGLQLINVAFGGTLYQDIETQQVKGALRHRDAGHLRPELPRHRHRAENTHLARLYPGVQHARVNSIHHQGIKDLAPGFDIEAWSVPDRVPEAIRRRERPRGKGYIAATQWHPEFHQANAHHQHAGRHRHPGRLPRRCARRAGQAAAGPSAAGQASATARPGCCVRRCCGADG